MPEEQSEPMAALFPRTAHTKITDKAHPAMAGATEDHHQVFHLHERGMYAVVSIAEQDLEGADTYVCLIAECWEVDEAGQPTGLRATPGTHSIPHFTVANDQVAISDIVKHLCAMMVDRLAKRRKALSSLDGHPIKSLPLEEKYAKRTSPRGINDDHHGI